MKNKKLVVKTISFAFNTLIIVFIELKDFTYAVTFHLKI